MEAVKDAPPYLRNRSESLAASADVKLTLDSGETLPAHSTLLSLHSKVFSDMLSLDRSGDAGLLTVPLPDCTLDAASSFLECIYATCEGDRITVKGADTVAKLAMKFGMDGILKDIDKFLSDKVALDGSSWDLWGTDVDKAVHWLSVAGNNNLNRLAAKAERFLVEAAGRLSDKPEAEHIPQRSLLHMLDSRHAAIERIQQTAKGCVHVFHRTSIRCANVVNKHTVVFPEAVTDVFEQLRNLETDYPEARSS